jgi:hypothetical protein
LGTPHLSASAIAYAQIKFFGWQPKLGPDVLKFLNCSREIVDDNNFFVKSKIDYFNIIEGKDYTQFGITARVVQEHEGKIRDGDGDMTLVADQHDHISLTHLTTNDQIYNAIRRKLAKWFRKPSPKRVYSKRYAFAGAHFLVILSFLLMVIFA